LWSIFSPQEYATVDVFLRRPDKAWKLYREITETLSGKEPNSAHYALARLEEKGRLKGIITQNIDGLHEAAGSKNVILIHGDNRKLQCIHCNITIKAEEDHFNGEVPHCSQCDKPFKPNYVLFGESVRELDRIQQLVNKCDCMLIIGTSCQVYPAAGLPQVVKSHGGKIYRFDLVETTGEAGILNAILGGKFFEEDYFFEGKASLTVNNFSEKVLSITGL